MLRKSLMALALSAIAASPVSAEEGAMDARLGTVIFSGLDKITARITRVETPIGTPVEFGTLQVVPRACHKRPPEETPETSAFVEVYDLGLSLADKLGVEEEADLPKREPERIFSGWMFASSPGLNAVEHPVYDVWVIDCNMAVPEETTFRTYGSPGDAATASESSSR